METCPKLSNRMVNNAYNQATIGIIGIFWGDLSKSTRNDCKNTDDFAVVQ
jgi:hypothetical protein